MAEIAARQNRAATPPVESAPLHRHPGDVIRLLLGSGVLVVTGALAWRGHVSTFEADIFRHINHLPEIVAAPLSWIMQLGAYPAVIGAALLALLLKHRRLALELFAGGSLAWLLGKVVKLIVERDRPAALLDLVIVRGAEATGLGFPSGHVAIAAVLATLATPYLSRRLCHWLWGAVWLVALGRIVVGAHFPIDVIGGAALGWLIGAAIHLAWGVPHRGLAADTIRGALTRAGLDLHEIRQPQVDARGSTPFFARAADGTDWFIKLIGRDQRNADLLFKTYRYLLYRELEDEAPFATPKQQIEHEAYLVLLAERAGVRVPGVLLTMQVNGDAAILVQRRVNGRGLDTLMPDEIDDDLLRRIWQQVALLHRARIAHRDLRRANVLIDEQGEPWIIDFGFSEAAASDRRLAQDVAEMLASIACIMGVERAAATALDVLGRDAVLRALPLVQPLALSTATRKGLGVHPERLNQVRQQVAQTVGVELPPVEPLTRVRLRTILGLAAAAFATYVLLPQVGQLSQTIAAIQGARPGWLVLGALGSLTTYLLATTSLIAAVGQPLALGRTFVVQFAASFANRLAPQGIGGVALNERYLERSGIERAAALTAITLNVAASGVMFAIGLAAALVVLQRSFTMNVRVPSGWPVLIAVVLIAVVIGLVVWSPKLRRRVWPLVTTAARNILGVLRQPARALQLFGSSAGVTLTYALTLAVSLRAFGIDTPLLEIVAVYIGGSAIASASPTPGGLGAIEAALVAALTALGVEAGPAVAGVLTFRLLTFWLPTIPGFFAFRALQRRKLI